jgi:hypothetical protein
LNQSIQNRKQLPHYAWQEYSVDTQVNASQYSVNIVQTKTIIAESLLCSFGHQMTKGSQMLDFVNPAKEGC